MSAVEPPAISVIVPFFNSERHIAACIESLLAQQEMKGSYEILLIDNQSKDNSPSIVARYPEVTVLEESQPGAYPARNAGIRRARGPLLAFTDADCVVATDWLRSIRHAMEDPTIAILLGHCDYPRSASPGLRLLAAYENSKTHYVTHHCPPAYRFAYANNMAVRAELFAEYGLFKEWRRAADTEFVHRLELVRPDLRTMFLPSMKITHMEFSRTRSRLRRLRVYTQTNSRIETFRELDPIRRLGVVGQLFGDLMRGRTSP